MTWLWILTAAVTAGLLTELIRRGGLITSLVVFGVLPAVLVGLAPTIGIRPTAFEAVKVVSLIMGSLFISLLRYRDLHTRAWARAIGYGIFFVNILEAMISESLSGTYVNALAGGLLLLSQAYPGQITVRDDDAQKNLRYGLGADWVLAYSLWNFAFLYGAYTTDPSGRVVGEWSAFALVHICVPLLFAAGRAELWIQARAYCLTLMMMFAITLPREPFMCYVPDWYHPVFAECLRWASLALAAFVLLRGARRRDAEGRAVNLSGSIFGFLRG